MFQGRFNFILYRTAQHWFSVMAFPSTESFNGKVVQYNLTPVCLIFGYQCYQSHLRLMFRMFLPFFKLNYKVCRLESKYFLFFDFLHSRTDLKIRAVQIKQACNGSLWDSPAATILMKSSQQSNKPSTEAGIQVVCIWWVGSLASSSAVFIGTTTLHAFPEQVAAVTFLPMHLFMLGRSYVTIRKSGKQYLDIMEAGVNGRFCQV